MHVCRFTALSIHTTTTPPPSLILPPIIPRVRQNSFEECKCNTDTHTHTSVYVCLSAYWWSSCCSQQGVSVNSMTLIRKSLQRLRFLVIQKSQQRQRKQREGWKLVKLTKEQERREWTGDGEQKKEKSDLHHQEHTLKAWFQTFRAQTRRSMQAELQQRPTSCQFHSAYVCDSLIIRLLRGPSSSSYTF